MPTLCLPGPGTTASLLFRKQIVSGRYVARSSLLLPYLQSCSSPLSDVSQGPTVVIQLFLNRGDGGTCSLVPTSGQRASGCFLPQISWWLRLHLPSWVGRIHIPDWGPGGLRRPSKPGCFWHCSSSKLIIHMCWTLPPTQKRWQALWATVASAYLLSKLSIRSSNRTSSAPFCTGTAALPRKGS